MVSIVEEMGKHTGNVFNYKCAGECQLLTLVTHAQEMHASALR
jgi:hypothetical protein